MMNHCEIRKILEHEKFVSMDQYRHHGDVSCLQHSLAVAEIVFETSVRKGLDFISATRGALLHDFYLYDWHTDSPGLHGFKHPYISKRNAETYFNLNKIEANIILRHMWPLTPIPPKYSESRLVSLADKKVTYKDYRRDVKIRQKSA